MIKHLLLTSALLISFCLSYSQQQNIIRDTGSVGIGTTSPNSILQVSKDISSLPTTGLYGQIEATDATNPAKRLSIGYIGNSTDAAFIQSLMNAVGYKPLLINPQGGNVGIGTTIPGRLLEVSNSSATTSLNSNPTFRIANRNKENGGITMSMNFSRPSSDVGTMQDIASIEAKTGGTITAAGQTGSLLFATMNVGTLAERMRIDNTGNVGIGNATPGSLLTVGVNPSPISGQQIGSQYSPSVTSGTYSNAVFQTVANAPSISSAANIAGYFQSGTANNSTNYTGGGGIGINPLRTSMTIRGTGTITSASHLYIETPTINNALPSPITTLNGIFISPQKTSSVTNAYGIYQAGSNDLNYLAGSLGIGTSPVTKLHVNQTSGAGAPSLSSDATGIFSISSHITQSLQFGTYDSSPYAIWMQGKRYNSDGTSWPIAINPLGGNVGIGTASPATTLHIGNGAGPLNNQDGSGILRAPDIQVNKTSGLASVAVGIQNGVNDRRAGFFVDQSNGLWGLAMTYTSGAIPFVIRGGVYGNEQLRIDNAGNIGIGTTAPTNRLHVVDGVTNSQGLSLAVNGLPTTPHAFIGATNQSETMWLTAGAENSGDQNATLGFTARNNDAATAGKAAGVRVGGGLGNIDFYTASSLTNGSTFTWDGGSGAGHAMRIANGGNVGIGTTNPKEKLSVKGTILAQKVRVSMNTLDWPDYVFHPTYKLRSLSSLEAYINTEKHLPDVPSSKDVAKRGIDIGETQAALLRKIEELTLYIIQQSKELQNQNKMIIQQNNKIKSVQKQLEKAIKARI